MATLGSNIITYDASNIQIFIADPLTAQQQLTTGIPDIPIFFSGTEPLTGFGEGDFLSISFDEPIANFRTGADGKEVISCNAAAETGTITISAVPGCPLERRLLRLAFPRNPLAKVNPFSIFIIPTAATLGDTSALNEFYFSPCAVIVERPQIDLGTDLGDRSFTIRASDLKIIPTI